MCVCISLSLYIYIYTCMYVCMYVCMYIYIYIYIYTRRRGGGGYIPITISQSIMIWELPNVFFPSGLFVYAFAFLCQPTIP